MTHRYRPHVGSSRAVALAAFVESFKTLGSLYGSDYEREAQLIREDLEALGLPMGYGRVARTPVVLAEMFGAHPRK
jgi:hypothetical protein